MPTNTAPPSAVRCMCRGPTLRALTTGAGVSTTAGAALGPARMACTLRADRGPAHRVQVDRPATKGARSVARVLHGADTSRHDRPSIRHAAPARSTARACHRPGWRDARARSRGAVPRCGQVVRELDHSLRSARLVIHTQPAVAGVGVRHVRRARSVLPSARFLAQAYLVVRSWNAYSGTRWRACQEGTRHVLARPCTGRARARAPRRRARAIPCRAYPRASCASRLARARARPPGDPKSSQRRPWAAPSPRPCWAARRRFGPADR